LPRFFKYLKTNQQISKINLLIGKLEGAQYKYINGIFSSH